MSCRLLPGAGFLEGWVTRIFGHYASVEMLLLCMAELVLAFLIVGFVLATGTGFSTSGWFGHGGTAALGGSPLRLSGVNLTALLALTLAASALLIGLYRPEIWLQRRRLLVDAAAAGAIAFPVALMISGSFHVALSLDYLMHLLRVLVIWTASLLLTRFAFGLVARHRLFVRRLVVLGSGDRAERASSVLRGHTGRLLELVGVEPEEPLAAGPRGELAARLKGQGVWGIVVACDSPAALPVEALLACRERGIRVIDELRFREEQLGRIDIDRVSPDWLVYATGVAGGRIAGGVRRLGDIATCVALLLLTLPLMLLTAIAIRCDSRGPVFYRQERVGLNGAVFTLFKFRSMRVDAENPGSPRWAARRDPRITRVGRLIRLTRIDELPQLLNVLRGEMCFIGPRPERPHFVEQLSQVIPHFRDRAAVKPGITGWAQVNYPYGASVEDARQKLSYDLYYVKNRSFILDLQIMVATVRVILFQEGAR